MQTATHNYFELFSLPSRFVIDLGKLESAFRRLQNELHPDRHVSKSETERRIALQLSTTVNDAYQTLRHPTSRAQCLIDMAPEAKKTEAVSPAFLMAQMEWHESIEHACVTRNISELQTLASRLRTEMFTQENGLAETLDIQRDFHNAAMRVNELRFYERLRAEINEALDQLDE